MTANRTDYVSLNEHGAIASALPSHLAAPFGAGRIRVSNRSRRIWTLLAISLMGLAVPACGSTANQTRPPSTSLDIPGPARSECTLAWGTYSDRNDTAALDSELRTRTVIAHQYFTLATPPTAAWLANARARGEIPLLSLDPTDLADPVHSIISGGADRELAAWGTAIRSFGAPIMIAPLTDMDVSSNAYAVGDHVAPDGQTYANSPADIIAAFQAIHDRLVAQVGQLRVLWVFNPRGTDTTGVTWERLYPGNPYVDWLALGAFNVDGTSTPPQPWESLSTLLRGTDSLSPGPYQRMAQLAPSKPMMLTAFGTVETGGDKPQWFHEAARDLADRHAFSAIHAVLYFDATIGSSDMHLDTSPASLAAARSAFGVTSPFCMTKAQVLKLTDTGE